MIGAVAWDGAGMPGNWGSVVWRQEKEGNGIGVRKGVATIMGSGWEGWMGEGGCEDKAEEKEASKAASAIPLDDVVRAKGTWNVSRKTRKSARTPRAAVGEGGGQGKRGHEVGNHGVGCGKVGAPRRAVARLVKLRERDGKER